MNYTSVPNIITGKDLDYLTDMFNWNYNAYKNNVNSLEKINDEEIKQIVKKAIDLFNGSMMEVLSILASGGAHE
jgi:hypothetical protein